MYSVLGIEGGGCWAWAWTASARGLMILNGVCKGNDIIRFLSHHFLWTDTLARLSGKGELLVNDR